MKTCIIKSGKYEKMIGIIQSNLKWFKKEFCYKIQLLVNNNYFNKPVIIALKDLDLFENKNYCTIKTIALCNIFPKTNLCKFCELSNINYLKYCKYYYCGSCLSEKAKEEIINEDNNRR